MNLTRCNHGHFYDMDKFESCPHCKNNGAGAAAEATVGLTGGTAGATEPYSGNAGDVTVPVGMTYWISLAIAIAVLVVAVYSGISYFREK